MINYLCHKLTQKKKIQKWKKKIEIILELYKRVNVLFPP